MKSKILNLVQSIAIVAGIIYGAVEIHNFREAREREVLIELLHTFQSPEYVRGLQTIRNLPDGLNAQQMRDTLKDDYWIASMVANTYEGLGVMVNEREIPLEFIENFQGGGARSAWQKLRPWVEDRRKSMNRPALFEYFQWLAEELDREYPTGWRQPAYVKYKDWKP